MRGGARQRNWYVTKIALWTFFGFRHELLAYTIDDGGTCRSFCISIRATRAIWDWILLRFHVGLARENHNAKYIRGARSHSRSRISRGIVNQATITVGNRSRAFVRSRNHRAGLA